MKEIIKNKKLLIICSAILLIVLTIGVVIYLNSTDEKTEKKDVEVMHTMYVSINPLVKLTYKEIYSECIDDTGETYICSEISTKVDSYELINNDAKEVYKDLEFKGKKIDDIILELCDTARNNNILFEKLTITSDSKNFSEEKLINLLKENSESGIDFDIFVNFEEKINVENILSSIPKEDIVYIVRFDSNGGNEIESQLINENDKVSRPTNPSRSGYEFLEWQMDEKEFDFNTFIVNDITLIAKWKKIENADNSNNNNNANEEDNNSNNTGNNSQDNNNSNNDDDSSQDNNNTDDNTQIENNKINLNDNVQYYESITCYNYIYVNPVCVNKSFNELKQMYPDYDKQLDSEYAIDNYLANGWTEAEATEHINTIMNEKKTISSWNDYFSQWSYFAACDDIVIPNSTLSELKSKQGMSVYTKSSNLFKFEFINFKDSAYDKYTINEDFSKYGIIIDGGCGDNGSGTPNYLTLNESICNKYNLECDRW